MSRVQMVVVSFRIKSPVAVKTASELDSPSGLLWL